MSRIDDPLDQVDEQHPPLGGSMLAKVLSVLGPLVEILNPPAGAGVTIAAYFSQLLDAGRSNDRAEAWYNGLKDAVKGQDTRIEVLEKRVTGLDATEAVIASVRGAFLTARADKAYRMGHIVGSTIASEEPNWQEAAEFIRDLEELGDADLEAVRLLWKAQRTQYRDQSTGELQMSTDNQAYMKTWTGVLDRVRSAGISKDDWLSRCARLAGFGLALTVDSPSRLEAQQLPAYRMTTRAVRLMQALGIFIPPGAYPVIRYHPKLGSRQFDDEDRDVPRGSGWFNDPNFTEPW